MTGFLLTAVGIGLGLLGSKKAAEDQQDLYDEQAEAARKEALHRKEISIYNARRIAVAASRVRRKGVEEENEVRRFTAERISSIRAAFAASGVIADSGSPARLQIDAARLGEVDALRTRRNYQDESLELDHRAQITLLEGDAERTGLENKASALTKAGQNAVTSGYIGAATDVFNASVDAGWFSNDSEFAQAANTVFGGG